MAVIRRWAAALLVVCVAGGVAVSTGSDVAVAGAQDQPEPVVEAVGDEVGAAGLVSRWFFTNNLTGGAADFELTFGSPTDADFYVGDWDGNGIDDLAYRRGKTFTLMDLPTRRTTVISYGKPGDEVFVGDWDGNGTDTFAVRRGNIFYVKNSIASGNADVIIGYGRAGDEVFVGDWDSNGTDTFAVRRGNVFHVRNSVTTGVADVVFGYGRAADQVLVGDWNGDNIDSFAVRRGKEIFIRNDFATAPAEFSFAFGKATDELYPGDWNGDNIDTFAVRRLTQATAVVLSERGLGVVDFGDPAEEALATLISRLGQPDDDTGWLDPGPRCQDLPGTNYRLVNWFDAGVQLMFTNWDESSADTRATTSPPYLGGALLVSGSPIPTDAGARAGDTLHELSQLYGDRLFLFDQPDPDFHQIWFAIDGDESPWLVSRRVRGFVDSSASRVAFWIAAGINPICNADPGH